MNELDTVVIERAAKALWETQVAQEYGDYICGWESLLPTARDALRAQALTVINSLASSLFALNDDGTPREGK